MGVQDRSGDESDKSGRKATRRQGSDSGRAMPGSEKGSGTAQQSGRPGQHEQGGMKDRDAARRGPDRMQDAGRKRSSGSGDDMEDTMEHRGIQDELDS